MIYRCEFTEIDGARYLASYRLVSERGRPSADDELGAAPGSVLTNDGRYRFRLVRNPDYEKNGDARPYMLEDNPQPAPVVDEATKAKATKRASIAAALPDILLAVAEGADLREEVRKAVDRVEAQRDER